MGEYDKPTQRAEGLFEAVSQIANRGMTTNQLEPREIAYFFGKTADGLKELAVGLRATYILLEEVRNMLRNQSLGGRR